MLPHRQKGRILVSTGLGNFNQKICETLAGRGNWRPDERQRANDNLKRFLKLLNFFRATVSFFVFSKMTFHLLKSQLSVMMKLEQESFEFEQLFVDECHLVLIEGVCAAALDFLKRQARYDWG